MHSWLECSRKALEVEHRSNQQGLLVDAGQAPSSEAPWAVPIFPFAEELLDLLSAAL